MSDYDFDDYEPLLNDEPADRSELNAWVAYPAPTIGGVCGYFNWATFHVIVTIDNDRYLYNRKWRYLGAPQSYARALDRKDPAEHLTAADVEKFVKHLVTHTYPREKIEILTDFFGNEPGCRFIDVRWDEVVDSWTIERDEAIRCGELEELGRLPIWE